ncbi:hypothetical protein OTB20_09555 [Streptomyces sp. H27-H1]|uniref:hypothetical protein n=1 Tax=Streptomyces sp. H27-H1 TaxID=2996461 RepID=UPI0022703E08|nr:hypothetical protein [Streptomyces sp. H27-H1]MCY0926444.1 hypothetical protein [Streptomyces sp. H27-H1]
MAKNKNRQQPAKSEDRSASQDPAKTSMESSPAPSAPAAPSPLQMAGKKREKKFGHN